MRKLLLLSLALIASSASALAQETQPGDSCAGQINQTRLVGGPETAGTVDLLWCNGSAWQSQIRFKSTGKIGINSLSPQAPLHVAGEAIIGKGTLACAAPQDGALRFTSSTDTWEFCNGSAWVPFEQASCGDSSSGYFVLTQGQWDGNLVAAAGGGMSGLDAGNALCLNDLATFDWKCKSRAQSRGLLNSTKVKAFLCDSSGCNDTAASTVYYYAYSNHTAEGGNKFKTDASGIGPQEHSNWDNFYNFGDTESFWSGRAAGGSGSAWPDTPAATRCTNWTSSSSGVNGQHGYTNLPNANRWSNGAALACNSVLRLVCIVNP